MNADKIAMLILKCTILAVGVLAGMIAIMAYCPSTAPPKILGDLFYCIGSSGTFLAGGIWLVDDAIKFVSTISRREPNEL